MAATIDDQVAELERANAELRRQLDACSAELKEARDQQTATAEVLQVINSSPGDLAPVFDAMLGKATTLCEAVYGHLWTYDGQRFHPVAFHGEPGFGEYIYQRGAVLAVPDSPFERILKGERCIHIPDVLKDASYDTSPGFREVINAGGIRTQLTVALSKDDVLLGLIVIYRQEVRPFSNKQISLLQNFAAQAVIAMENARLIAETREALEQQTATAEVLQVINSSPGDLAPVFDAMLEKALNLCGAAFGILQTIDGKSFQTVAHRGVSAAFADFLAAPREVSATGLIAEFLEGARFVHRDAAAGEGYRSAVPVARALVELEGARTLLAVPLRKDATLVGTIVIYRREVRPFSDKQVALLQNFAAQAVIAMENARLLTETREALEQQTATAEVLQVINSSPGDLAPVFDAVLDKGLHLCEAAFGTLWTFDGECFHAVALRRVPAGFAEVLTRTPYRPEAGSAHERLLRGAPYAQIDDAAADASIGPVRRALVEHGGARTVIAVPLLKDGTVLGAISAFRQEVRSFSDKQIALLQNFAAQAVIAMENARLITETREALEQQTATAEVLQVINSSPGDLTPVFDAVIENSMRLCEATQGHLYIYADGQIHAEALRGEPQFVEWQRRRGSHPVTPGSPTERALRGEQVIHIADATQIETYRSSPAFKELIDRSGIRTGVTVALRRDEAFLGTINVYRQEVRPFSDEQIALLQNFAAQAVIAMENARLLTETREALEQQTATAEVLQVINSSPGDLAPVFDAMLEKAHSLCGVARGSLELYDGENFRAVATHGLADGFAEQLRRGYPASANPATRPLIEGHPFAHILDRTQHEFPFTRGAVVGIAGTLLAVPLRKEERLLGAIFASRQEVRPFSDKQIALLQNFAAQAVIAMENARLITETREALEQQTATAEVLQVINSSPGELTPVFDVVLEKATRACDAAFGTLWTYDGERFQAIALRQVPEAYAEFLSQAPIRPVPFSGLGRVAAGESVAHFVDVAANEAYRGGDPQLHALLDLGKARSTVAVPLRKDNVVLGAITAYRQEVRPFSEKQIALLQNFAAQAVIAMENARLITETREALEQQTATAEVLQVINSSPGDLAPVFDAILEKAHNFCGAVHGSLHIADADGFRGVAMRGVPEAFADFIKHPFQPGPNHPVRELIGGAPFATVINSPEFDDPIIQSAYKLAGMRTGLFVPLRKDRALRGYIVAARPEIRPFTDKQIALLQNFAAQAVIAMENARLLTETREALAQQTATAEVLQVINSSPGDLKPVFDAILEKAHTLCGAACGRLLIRDGEELRLAAAHGEPSFIEAARQLSPERPPEGSMLARIVGGEGTIHVADARSDMDYSNMPPQLQRFIDTAGARTLLWVPLRKDGALLGVITAFRQEVRPFSDKQIALLQNFAAQAVIAMENARLLGETREALEQQTATAEVLQVINSSPGDLAPVFGAMLDKAVRLCDFAFAALWTYNGTAFHPVALHGMPAAFEACLRQHTPPAFKLLHNSAGPIHFPDVMATEMPQRDPEFARVAQQLGSVRTLLLVPLRKDAGLLGAFVAYRQEVRPFSDKQISLLQNFAAQAVIAMENARLLGELRERTGDLQESLEYQTATSDVLKVISQSGSEIEPVLETLLETAARICEADKGVITRLQNGLYRASSSFGFPAEYEDLMARSPIAPGRGSCVGRTALERRVVHIEDAATDPEFTWTESQQLGQLRTMLGVPLFREDALIGVISLARSRVEPFTEKQIALVRTFADQAVIAIENARLFNELRARTAELGRSVEELKMLGEVGRAVSSTLDLKSVLSTILTASLGVTWATAGAIFRYIRAERAFRLVEAVGWDEALLGSVGDLSIAETETLMSESASRRTPIQLTDLAELPSTPLRDASLAAGLRSVLIVPLVGPERIFGALVLQRHEAGEFPAETVRLMQTLASQSVLAIQNARLFREIADKSEQLALASQHKSQFLANMSHELRTPLNAILGYAELLVDGIYGVLPEKAQGVLERVQNNGKHLLALINDVLDLAKIEAGQLALTLEDYALAEVVRSVVTATEPLAAAKGLKFTAIVQESMPMAHGDARRVSQVLLNLAGNAIKFTDAGEVEINASAGGGQFLLTVRDTGPGIADADQERIFGEFQQIDNSDTRKKGGTGLGLAISRRMVEMQGGLISVDSVLGEGSTFRVVLPVHVEPALEEAA